MSDGLAQTDDGQGSEHVPCAAEEAIDGWDVDLEDTWREVGAGSGADDGHGGGFIGEVDGGHDDVGDAVGFVELGYCCFEA